jgi:hypothetical protein
MQPPTFKALTALALLLAAALSAPAQVTQALQSPAFPVAAGTTLEIRLLIVNAGTGPADVKTPALIPMLAATPLGARAFALRRGTDEPTVVTVPAGGFSRVVYVVPVPPQARGLGVLAAEDPTYGRIAVEVVAAPGAASPSPSSFAASAIDAPPVARPPGGGTTPTTLLARIPFGVLPHEPVYFSLGLHDRLNSRFQLSLKLRPLGPTDERVYAAGSFVGNLYGSFTQTSLWDLESESKPFFDSSYKPAVMYQRYDIGHTFLGAQVGYAVGFEHESNGQGGIFSRSMNLLVFRPSLRWALPEGWSAAFSPKLYYYVEKSENDDLPKYRGYGDYLFSVEHPDSWKLSATVRLGSSGKGSLLLDGSYPLKTLVGEKTPTGWANGFVHLQYFNGYNESLRTYNRRTPWQLRLGYMLIR